MPALSRDSRRLCLESMNDSESGVVVKAIDMANDMATSAIGFATIAVEQFGMEREMAGDSSSRDLSC